MMEGRGRRKRREGKGRNRWASRRSQVPAPPVSHTPEAIDAGVLTQVQRRRERTDAGGGHCLRSGHPASVNIIANPVSSAEGR